MKLIALLFLGTSSAFAVVGNLTGSLASMLWAGVFTALSTILVLVDAHKRGVNA